MKAGLRGIVIASILTTGLGGCQRIKRLIRGDSGMVVAPADPTVASEDPIVNLEDFSNVADTGTDPANTNTQ